MSYLGEGAQIPYLGRTEIEQATCDLLDECWDGEYPVDVENVCDYLGLSIVPVRDLACEFGVYAYISADFRVIYVEQQGYIEESPRYRFSVAHELGHYVLHQEYFPHMVDNNGCDGWAGFGIYYGYAERQANYFAGCLLAPEDELVWLLNDGYNGSFARNCLSERREALDVVLGRMRRVFGVSSQVIARRMKDVVLGLR